MRNKKNKHFGIEVSGELHYKIKYIAEYEGRSINRQILYIIQNYVREFESNHEKIILPSSKNSSIDGGL